MLASTLVVLLCMVLCISAMSKLGYHSVVGYIIYTV